MTSHDALSSTDTRTRDELPKIDILGAMYTVDWNNLRLLPPTGTQASIVELDNLPVTKEALSFQFLYHVATQSQVKIDLSIKALPPGVVVLEIPAPQHLDPIAVAKQIGLPDEAFLRQFPVPVQLSAKQVPWENSRIKEIVSTYQSKVAHGKALKKKYKPGGP